MTDERHLGRGREAYERGDWPAAYEAFAEESAVVPLSGPDLERWATTAYLLGNEDEFVRLIDRAHQRHLDHGDRLSAARCACWLALNLAASGAGAPASGWFARARRLLDGQDEDTVVHGYLELAGAMTAVNQGDLEAAAACADRAVAAGGRFGDDDLTALALHMLGRVELRRSRVEAGLALLDEAMATVASRASTPLVIGIVYCSVIDACRAILSLRRAHEWTVALDRWCEQQPGLVAFYGDCRVARAEMLVLRGAWHDAASEAERARDRVTAWTAPRVRAAALYQLAEVYRLRGELEQAERAYAAVSREGGQPYPGLALLRLARGQADSAHRSLRRRLADTADPARRTRLLAALVEATVAVLDSGGGPDGPEAALTEARAAAEELARIADLFATPALRALAEHAAGSVALAAGDPAAAVPQFRNAVEAWSALAAPYQAARARFALGRCLSALGDEEGAAAELAAARETFEELGAEPDLARLEALTSGRDPRRGLTDRELQVLTGLARGDSNRAIGTALGISERTVERHVSNVFDKLGVASRTEAVAVALRESLV